MPLSLAEAWSEAGANLSEDFRLPTFASLDGGPDGFDMRAAWSETGLTLTVRVVGIKQLPWCRENRVDESDGLRLWIDTRDTHNIRPRRDSATISCSFRLAAAIGWSTRWRANADQSGSGTSALPMRPGMLGVYSSKLSDGYRFSKPTSRQRH